MSSTESNSTAPASTERVVTRIEGEFAFVELNRPDKHNGLDLPMLEGLVRAGKALRANKNVRAVILSGAGESFSAGLDFASVTKKPSGIARALFKVLPFQATNLFQEASWVWRRLPIPVIAAVEGHCYGGGLQIALAADFRFAAPSADFSVLEARWGLIPDMSGSVTVRELVGMDLAKRLFMTGEFFSAEQAHAWGLVSEVADDPKAAALAFAAKLAERSPDAVASSKKLLQDSWFRSPRLAFAIETVEQIKMLTGKNAAIARKAGMAKQQPKFLPRR